jgi:nitronate monooxygenase
MGAGVGGGGMGGVDRIRDLSHWPIVVSPMAGGPSVPALTVAAANAGALSFLAGGYKTALAMRSEMDQVRAGTDAAFGVNVFVPGEATREPEALVPYVAALEPLAAGLGAEMGPATWDDDDFAAKIEVLLADPPPIVSFTFGIPPVDVLRGLQSQGVLVAITVTTPDEVTLAYEAGADCLCLQGSEAGAHRGAFVNDDRPDQDYPILDLLAQASQRTDVPLIAAGGVAGPGELEAVLRAGAVAAQAGTAFLRCHESGADPTYKAALVDPRFESTVITRAFSGRRARALANEFVREHEGAPKAYPEINNATRAFRAAAAAAGDAQHMSLYGGVNFQRSEARSAGEIIGQLAAGVPEGG